MWKVLGVLLLDLLGNLLLQLMWLRGIYLLRWLGVDHSSPRLLMDLHSLRHLLWVLW